MRINNLGNMRHLHALLTKPLEIVDMPKPEEVVARMRACDHRATVHLYAATYGRRHEPARLLDYGEEAPAQIHLAWDGERIAAAVGSGETSHRREVHNAMIDLLLDDEELRRGTLTAVVLMANRRLLGFWFSEEYAYLHHNIGSNWDCSIEERLDRANLPFTTTLHTAPSWERTIIYEKAGERKLLFSFPMYDLVAQKIEKSSWRGTDETGL